MALLPLRTLPDPVLRRKARKVRLIDASIHKLAEDMIDTMHHHRGVGLAANQVGVLKRVIVIELAEDLVRVLVNPEIIKREGAREVEEGCLSVPGYRGIITRAVWVRAKALELGGKVVRIKAEGLLAQVLEHEIDHLNGILYVDHLKKHEDLWELDLVDDTSYDEESSNYADLGTLEPEEATAV